MAYLMLKPFKTYAFNWLWATSLDINQIAVDAYYSSENNVIALKAFCWEFIFKTVRT